MKGLAMLVLWTRCCGMGRNETNVDGDYIPGLLLTKWDWSFELVQRVVSRCLLAGWVVGHQAAPASKCK